MANNSGPNKRLNGPDGRVRNTQTSNAARTPGVPNKVGTPSVPGFGSSYGEVAGATAGLASAYGSFRFVQNAMRQQRVGLKAGLKPTVKGIRAEAVGSMSDVINQAIDRGILGGSATSQEQVGVIAGMKSDVEAARQDVRNQLLASKVQEQEAYMQYQIQQQQMAMQAAAARQQAALQEAAIAAQQESSANLLSYIKSQGSQGHFQLQPGQTVTVKGVPVTITKGMTRQDIMEQVRLYKSQAAGTRQMLDARLAAGRM